MNISLLFFDQKQGKVLYFKICQEINVSMKETMVSEVYILK